MANGGSFIKDIYDILRTGKQPKVEFCRRHPKGGERTYSRSFAKTSCVCPEDSLLGTGTSGKRGAEE